MKLNHYTQKPFEFNPRHGYRPCGSEPNFKPVGLWLSDCSSDDGWKDWCETQQWNLSGITYKTEFICDISAWKVLRTTDEIVAFTDEYYVRSGRDSEIISTIKRESIDWPRVMREFPGILITPYNWPCRHRFMWYYGWDCASACVWDLSTVEPVDEVRIRDAR